MDKEMKKLLGEIISLILLLIIVIPICVNASDNYKRKKEQMLSGNQAFVDISSKIDKKVITVNSSYNGKIFVRLMLKISNFNNNYYIYLDDQVFDINTIEYSTNGEYRYYNLGIYEIDGLREFEFSLKQSGTALYEDNINYSFYTEGLL